MKVSDVPITIPQDKYSAITKDDKGSYELINSIPYPTSATGGIYTEAYFTSVENYLKQYAIPGSKTGHGNENVDFYTVGMLIEKNKDKPGTGTVHFRVHIPSSGFDGVADSNSSFIRACRANTIEFSIVATVTEENIDAKTGEFVFNADYGRPRLDAVGEGAMAQTVQANSKRQGFTPAPLPEKEEVLKLVKENKIDYDTTPPKSPWEAVKWDIIQNGKVMKKALSCRQYMGTPEERKFATFILAEIGRMNRTDTTVSTPKITVSLSNKLYHTIQQQPKTALSISIGNGFTDNRNVSSKTVYQDQPPVQPYFDNLMRETYGNEYQGWVGKEEDFEIINVNGNPIAIEIIGNVVYEK